MATEPRRTPYRAFGHRLTIAAGAQIGPRRFTDDEAVREERNERRAIPVRVVPEARSVGDVDGVRLDALLDNPCARSRLLTGIAAANAIVATGSVLLAAHSTEHIFEVLRALH